MELGVSLGKTLSATKMDQLVDYVIVKPSEFNKLITLYVTGNYRITHSAARVLEGCIRRNPSILSSHLPKLIRASQRANAHDSLKRNTVRLMQFVLVPRALQGKAIDMCFKFLANKNEPIAVKVFSMTVLLQNTHAHPDLRKELRILIEDQLPYAGPAFRSRARKTLKVLADS